jgi:hypothetical protein
MESSNREQCSVETTKKNNNNNKDMQKTIDHKEGYFTCWRRKNPRYNKWGIALIDIKEAFTEKEVHKKRKYDTKDLDITMTEDDAELVADKVQDRGEEVVYIT